MGSHNGGAIGGWPVGEMHFDIATFIHVKAPDGIRLYDMMIEDYRWG